MPGDIFAHVQRGQPLKIPAGAYNAFIEMAIAARQRALESTGSPRGGVSEGLVYVRNDSGGDLSRYAVLGIDGVIFTPTDNLPEFQNSFAFAGGTPSLADHGNRFVILYEPIPDGAIGLAYVFGVCPVTIDMISEDHRFATVIDGDSVGLQSATSGGVEILYFEPLGSGASGASWAVVRLSGGGGESVGQYMGMSHLNVTDNTMGHDFLRFTLPVELDP